MADKIQLRRDTAANWASANPVLAIGEIGILIDDNNKPLKLKLGDGVTAWSSLSYWISAYSSVDDDNDLGYYATEADLIAAHETGTAGQYATIGETDTIWMWSVSSEAWVDTGLSGGDWATMVHTATELTDPADDDEFGVLSSANSWVLRRLKWSVVKAAIKTYLTGLFTDRNYTNPTVSSGTLTFNFGSKRECFATLADGGAIIISGNITIAYSNATNAKTLFAALNLSAAAILTFPSSHISSDDRWDSLTLSLDAGIYQLSIMCDGANYHVLCSQAEV